MLWNCVLELNYLSLKSGSTYTSGVSLSKLSSPHVCFLIHKVDRVAVRRYLADLLVQGAQWLKVPAAALWNLLWHLWPSHFSPPMMGCGRDTKAGSFLEDLRFHQLTLAWRQPPPELWWTSLSLLCHPRTFYQPFFSLSLRVKLGLWSSDSPSPYQLPFTSFLKGILLNKIFACLFWSWYLLLRGPGLTQ